MCNKPALSKPSRPNGDHTAALIDDPEDGGIVKRFLLSHAALSLAFLKWAEAPNGSWSAQLRCSRGS
jgi:hypothetical protein